MGAGHKGKDEREAFQNRDLSWLQFNRRVQREADNPDNPLLERAKFLAITTSNLDEFMQVRYVGLMKAARGKRARENTRYGCSALELYRRVNREILRQNNMQYLLYEGMRSELYSLNVQVSPVFTMTADELLKEKELFQSEIRPYLKVMPFEQHMPRQKQLYMCVKLQRARRDAARFALIPLPTDLKRLYDLSDTDGVHHIVRLEEIVKRHAARLFPKEQVVQAAVFRVLRNQDFDVMENAVEDIVPAVREMLLKRLNGGVMRLEAEESMSEEMLGLLMNRYDVPHERRYRVTGPLDLNKMMMGLYSLIDRAELKYAPAQPVLLEELMGEDAFERIDERDYLMYHPYHSFAPVTHLMKLAAADPCVRAIKQTLYRVSSNSPIVAALADAARAGKRVTVLFEAHARFDEENNLFWGERLERAGCKVLYGLPGMKVHSKITLFEREVNGALKRTVHLGTGNYHDGTAKLYTDFGLLTADEQLTEDAAAFFEELEGREQIAMAELVKAPERLQTTLLQLIDREREHALNGRPARIRAKMNSLSDEAVINALLDAGRDGVEVELLVRGICCLIPEIEGISGHIHVRSIVGRNLEHARAFLFENGGEHEVYLSSADWMPRNLYKRVELMFPIKDERCRAAVENVLELQWNDTAKCRVRVADTSYVNKESYGRNPLNAQEVLLRNVIGVFDGTEPAMRTLEERL